VTEKLQHAFHRLVHPNARRFWATFPGHSCEQGVCHKDSSSSYVRGMRNPITHITNILLATKRSRRRKNREKQKLLNLGANFQPHKPENAVEHQTSSPLTSTGQTGEHHRSDRSLLVRLDDFHKKASHRSGRWYTPVRPV
jgi:hypothetical protein